ncbi:ABC transporter permease [candidate division KSB1 bacterium]
MLQKDIDPPGFAKWLLNIFSDSQNRQSLLGDAEEEFKDNYEEKGTLYAHSIYWLQVFISIPQFLKSHIYWSFTMFKNYLKFFSRNLVREKVYSFINISGLVIGLSCSFVMLLYVLEETSYDSFHKNSRNTYRVLQYSNLFDTTSPGVSFNLAPLLREKFPEIKSAARTMRAEFLLGTGDRFFRERKVLRTDPELFEIFDFKFIKGGIQSALQNPNSIILSKLSAEKYFGDSDPLGKTLSLRLKRGRSYDTKVHQMTVTAIIENLPNNTDIKADIFIPMETVKWGYENINRKRAIPSYESWTYGSTSTYILTPEVFNSEEFSNKLNDIMIGIYQQKKLKVNNLMNNRKAANYVIRQEVSFKLQPLINAHLNSDGLVTNFDKKGLVFKVYICTILAFLILIIAVINYITLSTARASARAKEIGIRKVAGATKIDLIKQITIESMMFTLLALPVALLMIKFLIPFINQVLNTELGMDYLKNIKFVAGYSIVTLAAGLLAGGYIAVYLSSLKPLEIIKKQTAFRSSKSYFRNLLVVLQLSVFIILLVSVFIVQKQLNYASEGKDLGFERNDLIAIEAGDRFLQSKFNVFKNELLKSNYIENVSASFSSFVDYSISTVNLNPNIKKNAEQNRKYSAQEQNENKVLMGYKSLRVDRDFIETMGLNLIEGESLSGKYSSDRKAVIVNETFVKHFNLENPVGKKYKFIDENLVIAGVVKDFHSQSLYRKIQPMVFLNRSDLLHVYYVKYKNGEIENARKLIEDTWNKINPNGILEYQFVVDQVEGLYRSDINLGKMITYFTFLSIIVSCLGLFGLSLYSTRQKTNEIGIRKVMGASILQILKLLSNQYLKVIFISGVIACPVAWYIMQEWLQDFAYRAEIRYSVFLIPVMVTVLIVFITISFHTVKAAGINPVDSLRDE